MSQDFKLALQHSAIAVLLVKSLPLLYCLTEDTITKIFIKFNSPMFKALMCSVVFGGFCLSSAGFVGLSATHAWKTYIHLLKVRG